MESDLREVVGDGDEEGRGGPEEGPERDDAGAVVADGGVGGERVAGGLHRGAAQREGAERRGRGAQRLPDLRYTAGRSASSARSMMAARLTSTSVRLAASSIAGGAARRGAASPPDLGTLAALMFELDLLAAVVLLVEGNW